MKKSYKLLLGSISVVVKKRKRTFYVLQVNYQDLAFIFTHSKISDRHSVNATLVLNQNRTYNIKYLKYISFICNCFKLFSLLCHDESQRISFALVSACIYYLFMWFVSFLLCQWTAFMQLTVTQPLLNHFLLLILQAVLPVITTN